MNPVKDKTIIKTILLKENYLLFFFSLAVMFGPSISILFSNDLSQFHDCETYLGLARLDFDQSAVRRYRLLVPFAAGLLDYIGGGLFKHLAPDYFKGDFSLSFSFFLVNSCLMALFSVLIYRYCRAFKVSRTASLIGLVFVLTSRYTIYFASLPMVDSLFCVMVALTLLGLKEKNTKMLLCCIFLGPIAKESYLFVAPLIFLFSHLPKQRLFVYFLISGLLAFSFHFIYDYLYPPTVVHWLKADLYHIPNVLAYLPMLFSFYGLYKMLISIGFWIGLPLLALCLSKPFRKLLREYFDKTVLWFLILVLVQMLLSGSMERMFYLSMPVLAMLMARAFEAIIGVRNEMPEKETLP